MSFFPDPRRIVTGHDEQGNAIVLKDSQIPCVPISADASFAVLWETSQFPANLNGSEDPIETRTQNLANDKGVVLRIVDIPPNTVTVGLRFLVLGDSFTERADVPSHGILGLRNIIRRRA
jgi:hypothetical protein